jgi:hypothetical protein
MSFSHDDEENRKRVTAALARAQPVIFIDNIRDGIDSAVLSMALTSTVYSDRLLGQTRMLDLPNQALWLATANNPRLSLEIARRCVRIRLDPHCDRPWQRRSFKHERLMAWVREHRAELVHAALVLVQKWIAAGRPAGERSIGSYESWSEIIGGILAVAGVEGFLSNLEELYEHTDTEGQEWREFVASWAEQYGSTPVTAGVLLNLAIEHELLCNIIGDKSVRSQATRLGKALLSNRDRQYGVHRITTVRGRTNQNLWRLTDARADGLVGGNQVINFPATQPENAGRRDNVLHTSCKEEVNEINPLQDMKDMQDITIPRARKREDQTYTSTLIHIKSGENVLQRPHVLQDVENKGETSAGRLQDISSTSFTSSNLETAAAKEDTP